jgi:hypothetical protein
MVLQVDNGVVEYDTGEADGKFTITGTKITSRAVQSVFLRDDVSLETGKKLVVDVTGFECKRGWDTMGLCVSTRKDMESGENLPHDRRTDLITCTALRGDWEPFRYMRDFSHYSVFNGHPAVEGREYNMPEAMAQMYIARLLDRTFEVGYVLKGG